MLTLLSKKLCWARVAYVNNREAVRNGNGTHIIFMICHAVSSVSFAAVVSFHDDHRLLSRIFPCGELTNEKQVSTFLGTWPLTLALFKGINLDYPLSTYSKIIIGVWWLWSGPCNNLEIDLFELLNPITLTRNQILKYFFIKGRMLHKL